MRDFIFEACLFGDLNIVPNSFRFLAMGGELDFAELGFCLDLRLNFGGAFSLQAFQLCEPALRIIDLGLRFGNFLIDPVGQRVIVHDHLDDREDGREISAPEDGDDCGRKDAGHHVDSVGESDFQCALEIVHGCA